jgi:hypothetical protein
MLRPLYFSRLVRQETEDGNSVVVVSQEPLPEGVSFSILGYAQFDIYTLVKWRQGYEEEYYTGENLWRGETPIAVEGGVLSLHVPPVPTPGTPPLDEMTIWSRVDSTIGSYGVSVNAAIALRDPKNIVYF